MRTRKQQIADMEKRMEELRAEAKRRDADPKIQMPCSECRWYKNDEWEGNICKAPLVVGFNKYAVFMDQDPPALCGPEKALWEPRTFWQKSIVPLGFVLALLLLSSPIIIGVIVGGSQ